MSLFDIKDRLYQKKEEGKVVKEAPFHEADEYDPKVFDESGRAEMPTGRDLWLEKQAGLGKTGKKFVSNLIPIIGLVLVIIIVFVLVTQINKLLFTEGSAFVSISGPDQVKSGRLLSYEIKYKNGNRVDINDAVIKVTYSEDFKPEESSNFKAENPTSGVFNLGTIKKNSEGKVVLNGKIYSPKGALIYFKTDLSYQPSSFSSRFNSKSQIGVNVISTPIRLEIQAPQNVSSGDAVNYMVNYQNEGSEMLTDMRIRMEYPDQFTFSDSDPKASESNNVWYLGSLSGGQSGRILISGKLEGDRDKVKSVNATIGTIQGGEFIGFNDEKVDTRIVSSPLFITQTVNGLENLNASAGDTLMFKIIYKNNGDIGLRNVIITEKLESPALDYASLKMPGGSYDFTNKIITWKASDFPVLKNLEPGQGGEISFYLRLKEVVPLSSANDKNFVISSLAKIDSPDVPTPISMNKIISGNKMDIRLNSKIILDVSGYYNDFKIPNSGPIPPRVNQETTYTLHWKITNVSNDISETRVSAYLPTNARMTGKIYPEDAHVTYNERDNSVLWEAGNVSSGTGILSVPQEVAFQVLIKPSPEQAGRDVGLIGVSTITAKDNFTGENLKKTASARSTLLIEDQQLMSQDGTMVKN